MRDFTDEEMRRKGGKNVDYNERNEQTKDQTKCKTNGMERILKIKNNLRKIRNINSLRILRKDGTILLFVSCSLSNHVNYTPSTLTNSACFILTKLDFNNRINGA